MRKLPGLRVEQVHDVDGVCVVYQDHGNSVERPSDQVQAIKVEYEIPPDKSLFLVDGEKLAAALQAVGYPSSLHVPLSIADESQASQLARYDGNRKRVYIFNAEITMLARDTIVDLKQRLDLPTETPLDVSFVNFIKEHPSYVFTAIFYMVNSIPYTVSRLLGVNIQQQLLVGNAERRNKYLEQAKNGTLQNNASPDDQKLHALEFMKKQMTRALERHGAAILAHEYTHAEHAKKQDAIKMASVAVTMILAMVTSLNYIEPILIEHFKLTDLTSQTIAGVSALGVAAILSASFGLQIGRSKNEFEAFAAGDKFFPQFIHAFKINTDLLNTLYVE